MRTAILLLLLVVVGGIFGCGRGDGIARVKVRGTVTHKGQPVAVGIVRFNAEGGTVAPVTITPIKDGRYECAKHGGVPVGTHRVTIFSYDPNVPPPRGPQDPVQPQLLPRKYNYNSQLVWTLQEQRGWLRKDWDLQ